jgi:hypothetical protein
MSFGASMHKPHKQEIKTNNQLEAAANICLYRIHRPGLVGDVGVVLVGNPRETESDYTANDHDAARYCRLPWHFGHKLHCI